MSQLMTEPISHRHDGQTRSAVERYCVFKVSKPLRHATTAKLSSRKHRCHLGTNAGDCRFFAGWLSDPFFFDANGLFNKMQFTGDDFFADKNVCGIVIELPNSALATNKVGLWARTLDKLERAGARQTGVEDRCRRFFPGEEREAYLNGEPADDDRFIGVFAR